MELNSYKEEALKHISDIIEVAQALEGSQYKIFHGTSLQSFNKLKDCLDKSSKILHNFYMFMYDNKKEGADYE